MVKALLDSNILMDLMNGIQAAYDEIDYDDDLAISAITWMEVVVGLNAAAVLQFEAALTQAGIRTIHTNQTISRLTAAIRQGNLRLKLPDAIVGATANAEGRLVVTRNPKDFGANQVRVPYDCKWDDASKRGNVTNVTPAPF
ncbi:PIN domain-containing protein [Massilia sp. SR12]